MLLGSGNPIVNRRGNDFRNAIERQITILLHEFNQPSLAKFSEIIFGLGDAVTVCEEKFARAKLYGAFVVTDFIEEAHDSATVLESSDRAARSEHQRRQLSDAAECDPPLH